jgi:hydrogenase maturation factor
VSWAKVLRVQGGELVVERTPLVLGAGKLVLGAPVQETVLRQIDGRGFIEQAAAGDWVSVHWGWACEVLSERQLGNLQRFTRHHLAIANQTL